MRDLVITVACMSACAVVVLISFGRAIYLHQKGRRR